jgi:hypothetical protein
MYGEITPPDLDDPPPDPVGNIESFPGRWYEPKANPHAQGESLSPICNIDTRVVADVEDMNSLRDRCTIRLGYTSEYPSTDLSISLPQGYEPTTSKSDMYN